jgi:hypothetical protein
MTAKMAKCESTGKEIVLAEGYLVTDVSTGEWTFMSINAPDRSFDYSVRLRDLVKSPEAFVDWLAHLNEKTWFDSGKVFAFFTRLRHDNKLFGSL